MTQLLIILWIEYPGLIWVTKSPKNAENYYNKDLTVVLPNLNENLMKNLSVMFLAIKDRMLFVLFARKKNQIQRAANFISTSVFDRNT